jgi:hypothetical protein
VRAFWIGAFALGVAAGGCAPPTCESICDARGDRCGVDVDECVSSCASIEAVSDRFGCVVEQDDALACEAQNSNICGAGLELACAPEIEARGSCLRTACGEAPMDAACIGSCTDLCRRIASACGTSSTDCESYCQLGATTATRTGCGPEYWAQLGCTDRTPSAACSLGATRLTCPAETAAVEACTSTFCAANPADPLCIVPQYRSCTAASNCASPSSCLTIQTTATSGSMCTTSCTEDFDCPSRGGFLGACLSVSLDSTFHCYVECATDADCGAGGLCIEVTRTDGGTQLVCFPDDAS